MRLVRGRLFNEADGPNAPRVGIINETFARRLFPGEDPIGKRVHVSMGPLAFREVVGIVADTKQYGLDHDGSSQFYEPYGQLAFSSLTLVVRTAGDPAALTTALRGAVRAIDPDVPVERVRRLDDLVAESLATERFSALLLGAFAASALFVAMIGLYGVMAYTVGQRTLEIGIRMAHGARPARVLGLVLGEGLGLTAAGIGLGLAAALAGGRLISSQLFGVTTTDPLAFTLGPAALLVVAAAACAVPAWRAARVDPIVALRAE